MSPSFYIFSIPVGLIAVASIVARQQESSFQNTPRTANIQRISHHSTPKASPVTIEQIHPGQRLDHDRYGFQDAESSPVSMLGRDGSMRPLGARAGAPRDWLELQQAHITKKSALPNIAGYTESPAPADPLAVAIAPESAYQITADEVTRLDLGNGRVVFNKNVRMISPQFNLTSDQLVIHLGKDKNSMKLTEAHGSVNVLLTGVPAEKAYRGQSSDAIFDPGKATFTLTGWPKVKGASQEQVAAEATTRMTLFTKTGRLFTEGRAQTRVTKAFVDVSTTSKKE